MKHMLFEGSNLPVKKSEPIETTFMSQKRRQREFERKLAREQHDRIRASELLRAKLTHGLNEGQEAYSLLGIALECIAAMANDKPLMESFKRYKHE